MPKTEKRLKTAHGTIPYPLFIPLSTFGPRYPLDSLIQPYLPRLCKAVLVSYHYAQEMKTRPRLPLLIDSSGFAAIEEQGLGVLEVPGKEGTQGLRPADVLDFQEQHAHVAFTLDFPIPPKTDPQEAAKRQNLTIANAIWALHNRRRGDHLPLFASIQAWDQESARQCAAQLASYPFKGFAIGGLVPRIHDFPFIESIIAAVRNEIGERPLHVFGIGKPELIARLFELGVDSIDSSSYIKLAADGRAWDDPNFELPDPSPTDRLHLALRNLATATQIKLPLSVYSCGFLKQPAQP